MAARVVLVALAWLAVAAPAGAADFWVAPAGSDRNPGTEAAPFATLARAQLATRHAPGPDTVTLRGGTYRLTRPLRLDPRDSDVTWQAAQGESPVLSGGVPVTGWSQLPNGQWRAPAGKLDARQLYVGGVRAARASGVPPALVRTPTGYTTADGSTLGWRNPQDVELVYDVKWRELRGHPAAVAGGTITMQQPFFANATLDHWATIDLPTAVENAYELLDRPGEWYLDRAAHTFFYLPRPGEEMATAEVIVPVLSTLVDGRGTLDRPLHDVTFDGITFADTTWLPNASDGVADVQADMLLTGRNAIIDGTDDKLVKMPAAVQLRGAQRVGLLGDRFVRLGGAGVDISFGSRDDTIQGCELTDISGNGIQLGDVSDHHPTDAREPVQRISVADNWIHGVAAEYRGGVGIWGGYLDETTIAHNELSDLPYTAISLGWGWGTRDVPPTPAGQNTVEANDVHDVMQVLEDGGGIYLLGAQPGSVVRGNVVAHVPGWGGAIYLDDGSIDESVVGNVVIDSHQWPYMLKGTRLTVRDNVWDSWSGWGYYKFEGTSEGNRVIYDPDWIPRELLAGAGLEPAYRSRLRGA